MGKEDVRSRLVHEMEATVVGRGIVCQRPPRFVQIVKLTWLAVAYLMNA